MNLFKFLFLSAILTFSLFLAPELSFAQADPCSASIVGKSNAQLQADLDACTQEIERLTTVLNNTKQNTANYANEVAKLKASIDKAQANIKSKTIAISNLNTNISVKQSEISRLETKIETDLNYIADLIRKTKRIDSLSMVEAVLSEKNLSDFFSDVDSYSSTRMALMGLVDSLRGTKSETEVQKQELSKQRDAEAAAKAEIEAAKKRVEADKAVQDKLLAQSKDEEKAVAGLVADKQARAAAIRTALFGLRDSEAIPFSLALDYAEQASAKTGVRAAFILGIFATESGKGSDGTFGRNVGQCLLTNIPNKGDGKGKNTGTPFAQVMKGTRDVDPFLEIMGELGREPYTQPVSCPQSGGYGGAMGPAQFIPSTWSLLKSKIAKATGKSVPDPWNPADAFMASALLLADIGANTQDWTNERTAACKYNSGKTCYRTVYNSKTGKYETVANPGLIYGEKVMYNAEIIQRDIDFLQGV